MKNIAQSFSKASNQYDDLSDIQLNIARRLVEQVRLCGMFTSILDVGTGTGRVARDVHLTYPEASVVGLDIARGMVQKASTLDGNVHYACADGAALPFKPYQFDLVISSSAFQWIKPLPKALSEVYRCLKPDGLLAMAMFGEQTFYELFEVLEEVSSGRFNVLKLPKEQDLEQVLQVSKLDFELKSEVHQVEFADVWSLLKWTKRIGANNLETYSFIGRDMIKSAELLYRQKYPLHEGIRASFQIFWVFARKQ